MDSLFINTKLCSNKNDSKTQVELMENYPGGRRRYRVRAYRPEVQLRPNEMIDLDKYKHFESNEVEYQFTAHFIHWMLRSNFLAFTLSSVGAFVLFTVIFAFVIIFVAVAVEPMCVTSQIFHMKENSNVTFMAMMNDAINLSWTTFSTVGYGMISPSTSAYFGSEKEGHKDFIEGGSCAVMGFLLSFESLVGILFISSAGAILFSKLIQFQSNAQVKFSTVMIVKYGDGVNAQDIDDLDDEDDDNNDEEEEEGENRLMDKQQKKEMTTPCPILIFRVVNLQHSSRGGGEIVNAHLNTVATVDLKNAVMSHITRSNAVFRNALGGKNEETMQVVYRGGRAYYSSRRLNPNSSSHNGNKDRWKLSSMSTDSVSTVMSSERSEVSRSTSGEGRTVRFGNLLSMTRYSSDPAKTILNANNDVSNHTKKTHKLRSSMMHLGISSKDIGFEDDILSTIKSSSLSTIKSSSLHGSDGGDGIKEYDKDKSERSFVSKEVLKENVTQVASMHLNAVLGTDITIHKEAQVEMPNLVFAKVIMTPVRHPYFRTSWRVVHTLNEESPLLSKSMRNKIKDNNGYWPKDMYTPDEIENSIDFDQFLVSFRGLSKTSGSDVYAHHVYKKKDVKVGYQFASILVQNPNGSIGVEPDFIDELKEQDGGRYLND
eukprot:CAMPEP_0203675716 /NCGR_PEP_ID=MMETSP0090-20130426/21931_1 /ASSEMBLY_ACC=CAM_ASM_001088 /TAXON_ID=426623 /ORGANISM="Chaetoceros affinis, Strain CCMP159" /LENGTH=655 /DNA_ID=CAMNT_0050542023 /DNA_START=321 /DNA_END=2288 /DNA_ORIENTATION=-